MEAGITSRPINTGVCRKVVHQSKRDVHLEDHDDVRFALERIDTLHQFGVMEAVHDADLLPDVFLLLR